MRAGPSDARRSWSSPAVRSGVMGRVDVPRMRPASMRSAMVMTEFPVVVSPASMARTMGAAPRQRGRREAWRLMTKRSAMSSGESF